MRKLIDRLAVTYAAGTLGGLANALAVWAFGTLGITTALGVAIAPALSETQLVYPKLVWGGIWGWAFLLPWDARRWWVLGLCLSIAPTLVQLLVVFPYATPHGWLGLKLGTLTPLFVVIFNAVWGLVTAALVKVLRLHRRGGRR